MKLYTFSMDPEQPLYKPYAEREPDDQYQRLLKRILDEGIESMPIHGDPAKRIVGAQLRYDVSNGFPAIMERDLSSPLKNEPDKSLFSGALGEHIGFLNGARTLDELVKYGMPRSFWERWVTKEKCDIFGLPEGDLGEGSYGVAWAAFPTAEGEPFNQIDHLVRQIKERPYLRTHRLTNWIPQYTLQHEELQRKVVVAPCHGDVHILASPETKELSLHHFQRSGDVPVGVPLNMVQYAALGLMISRQVGYRFKEVVYTISDAHIYRMQYEKVKELIEREPRRLGTVALIAEVEKIQDHRPSDFELSDYDAHPKMFISTPV